MVSTGESQKMIIKGQDNQMTEEKVRKRMEVPVYSLSLLWRETEYSYSTNGQPYREQLPGRRSFGICTMKCFLPDGTSLPSSIYKTLS